MHDRYNQNTSAKTSVCRFSFQFFVARFRHEESGSIPLVFARFREDYQSWVDWPQNGGKPGVPWQPLLDQGIRDSKSVAVLVGNDGERPWQAEETMAVLQRAVREQLPVIPILLPNAPLQPTLPMFLENVTWADLRGGLTKDDVDKLVWGITGTKPKP